MIMKTSDVEEPRRIASSLEYLISMLYKQVTKGRRAGLHDFWSRDGGSRHLFNHMANSVEACETESAL